MISKLLLDPYITYLVSYVLPGIFQVYILLLLLDLENAIFLGLIMWWFPLYIAVNTRGPLGHATISVSLISAIMTPERDATLIPIYLYLVTY